MKYYVPQFRLGVLEPRQASARDKFGGLPWGLPADRWPTCRECDKSMALVAQLFHHAQRLPLGEDGACLFVFMCSNADSACVETWDSDTGGNAAFVLGPDELESGLTFPPDVEDPESAAIRSSGNCYVGDEWDPERTIWINTEVHVAGWDERDDGIGEEMRAAFARQDAGHRIARKIQEQVHSYTKLGSVPSWLQDPPRSDWTFLGQFTTFVFPAPMPSADAVGCVVMRDGEPEEPARKRFDGPEVIEEMEDGDGTWSCATPNYGDSGNGYVFRTTGADGTPAYEFIWQS